MAAGFAPRSTQNMTCPRTRLPLGIRMVQSCGYQPSFCRKGLSIGRYHIVSPQ